MPEDSILADSKSESAKSNYRLLINVGGYLLLLSLYVYAKMHYVNITADEMKWVIGGFLVLGGYVEVNKWLSNRSTAAAITNTQEIAKQEAQVKAESAAKEAQAKADSEARAAQIKTDVDARSAMAKVQESMVSMMTELNKHMADKLQQATPPPVTTDTINTNEMTVNADKVELTENVSAGSPEK